MVRTIHNLEQTYVYNYPVPEKENSHVTRLMPDARGGDTYQLVVDMEATPDEIFDATADFDLMADTSHIIKSAVTTQKDEDGALLEMELIPEVDPGKFYYRYAFDRKNHRMHFWAYDYEGPGEQLWTSIDVETRIYSFGKFSRYILTENFCLGKDQPAVDCVPIFTAIGYDIIGRVKKRREIMANK